LVELSRPHSDWASIIRRWSSRKCRSHHRVRTEQLLAAVPPAPREQVRDARALEPRTSGTIMTHIGSSQAFRASARKASQSGPLNMAGEIVARERGVQWSVEALVGGNVFRHWHAGLLLVGPTSQGHYVPRNEYAVPRPGPAKMCLRWPPLVSAQRVVLLLHIAYV